MIKYIVLSDSAVVTRALKKCIETLFADEQAAINEINQVHTWTLPASGINSTNRPQLFDSLTEWISGILYDNDQKLLHQVIAYVRVPIDSLSTMNPLGNPSPASLIGMLILAFPEIQWVMDNSKLFPILINKSGAIPVQPNAETIAKAFPVSLADAVDRMKAGHAPLFDGDGSRNALYKVISEYISESEPGNGDNTPLKPADYLPLRDLWAAAIDDEKSYAYFNAYTAYRFGFRAYSVTTLTMMELLLKDEKRKPDVIFEDIYLNFPDRSGDDHLSEFYIPGAKKGKEGRNIRFPAISNARFRVLVTCGGGGKHEQATRRENTRQLKIQERKRWPNSRNCSYSDESQKWWSLLHKPVSGVFDIFRISGLRRWTYSRNPPVFLWPPEPKNEKNPKMAGRGHSSPSALLSVAVHLIDRAERLQDSVHSAEEAVRGAVLCNIACELLGCLTPTIALEALSLKHYFEALAECQFYGVQAAFEVQKRLADMEAEADAIARCFDSKTRKLAVLNGKASIVDNLAALFREQNQFDEEQQCLIQARELRRKIWVEQHIPFSLPIGWAWWYVTFLVSAPWRFALAMLAWWGGLAVLFSLLGVNHGSAHWVNSASVFFGIQPPAGGIEGLGGAVVVAGMVAGFVHLGIFISHIYSIISRR